MNMQLCRQAAAAGQPMTWPQPAALNVPGQRACNLQEWRKRRITVEVDHELPIAG